MPHYFTLLEANETLKIIKPLMEEVQQIRRDILARQPEMWETIKRSAGNGGNPTLSKMVKTFDRLDDLLHRILATGAQVKDINTGLLDFSALKDGREVYLCWRYGEEEIEYWHEVEAGFAGRQPIDLF
ncbi:MAG: DUF2203 domain-containing protein [Chloroflexi bacterium]|nr:DUF2203 domain-containing protein [Chloroflexota bacterium]